MKINDSLFKFRIEDAQLIESFEEKDCDIFKSTAEITLPRIISSDLVQFQFNEQYGNMDEDISRYQISLFH